MKLTVIFTFVALTSAAGVYLCSGPQFTGDCQWIDLEDRLQQCIQPGVIPSGANLSRNILSFGPDQGIQCTVNDGDQCDSNEWYGPVVYPGDADLRGVGWQGRVGSFLCWPVAGWVA